LAPEGLFACRDGLVAIGCEDSATWRCLHTLLSADGVVWPLAAGAKREERWCRRRELAAAIGAWTADRPVAWVLERLAAAGVPAAAVRAMEAVPEHPQVAGRQRLVRLSAPSGASLAVIGVSIASTTWDGRPRRLPGGPGAETATILTQVLGLAAEQVQELLAQGVVG
jgi:formyl-CoA transferase